MATSAMLRGILIRMALAQKGGRLYLLSSEKGSLDSEVFLRRRVMEPGISVFNQECPAKKALIYAMLSFWIADKKTNRVLFRAFSCSFYLLAGSLPSIRACHLMRAIFYAVLCPYFYKLTYL